MSSFRGDTIFSDHRCREGTAVDNRGKMRQVHEREGERERERQRAREREEQPSIFARPGTFSVLINVPPPQAWLFIARLLTRRPLSSPAMGNATPFVRDRFYGKAYFNDNINNGESGGAFVNSGDLV